MTEVGLTSCVMTEVICLFQIFTFSLIWMIIAKGC